MIFPLDRPPAPEWWLLADVAYIDPTVTSRLVAQGKLLRIDRRGRRLDLDARFRPEPRPRSLGPIPLPLHVGGRELDADWFAVVRHTELEPVTTSPDRSASRGAVRPLRQHRVPHVGEQRARLRDLSEQTDPGGGAFELPPGDVFGSQRCDCGPQLEAAMERLSGDGGIVVYMAGHEGRGIGLWAKAATYVLQDGGENTYQANRSLGLPDDSRDFSDAAALLLHFLGGDRPFRLLTNNPKKVEDLRAHGLGHITVEKHVTGVGEHNRRYLAAKRDWGHAIEDGDLEAGGLGEPRSR